ncbi:hypothetical recombinase [Alphaspiravirus yamagawaense]|uniref:Hypothetical recombinase n=1 Tax=Alphaspiravirus yamagawaense TaxID=1157339 RepID=J7QDG6_9VIRU|nr:hypothetical recombinase [Aeropyrum coil-shaped virus]CCG27846.1 hypothetical recombinase [Aeropyrum coil-shaped virus]
MPRPSIQNVLDLRRDEVLELLGRGIPAEDVAKKFGVSRRTLYRWLERQGLTVQKIREEYQKLKEERERRKRERLAAIGEIPEDFEKFVEIEEVRKFLDWLKARRVTTAVDIVRTLHRVCLDLGIHPMLLLEDEGKEKLTSLLAKYNEMYKKWTVESIKANLRLWYKFNEKMPPAILSLEAYKSNMAHLAWFNVSDRAVILETAFRLLDKEQFDKVRAALLFLFYTGSRAEALTNVRFEAREVQVDGKRITAIIAITREKGRHGKKQWEKPLHPVIYEKYIKGRLPFSQAELKWLRRVLKAIYREALKGQESSVKYEYAMKHVIHIWRHTAAMSMLHATDWNVGLVAEILGWESPDILLKIYGRMPPEWKIAQALGVTVERPPFRFVYGNEEERLKELRILELP